MLKNPVCYFLPAVCPSSPVIPVHSLAVLLPLFLQGGSSGAFRIHLLVRGAGSGCGGDGGKAVARARPREPLPTADLALGAATGAGRAAVCYFKGGGPGRVALGRGGLGQGRAEKLASYWLSRRVGTAPSTYSCVPLSVSVRRAVRMRGGRCAGRRGWGERWGSRGRGAGSGAWGAGARGAASQSRQQPPQPAGAAKQRMPAARSPLLCAPAISSTSS